MSMTMTAPLLLYIVNRSPLLLRMAVDGCVKTEDREALKTTGLRAYGVFPSFGFIIRPFSKCLADIKVCGTNASGK